MMKLNIYVLVTIVLIALAPASFGQKRKIAPVAPKKSVAPPTPRINEVPFDEALLKSERLPSNFIGNNFEVVKSLIPSSATAPKGEFESTQAYKERLDRVGETVLINSLKLNSLLAFTRTGLSAKYDADAEVLSVRVPVGQALLELFLSRLPSSYRTIILSRDSQNVGAYIGQNAFGAKKEIAKVEQKSRYLVFKNYGSFREYLEKSPYDTGRDRGFSSRFDSYETKDLEFRLQLPPASAESAKSSMAALFIFRLGEPYAGVSIRRSEPKMDYPTDSTDFQNYLVGSIAQIWLYNKSNGEIYKKIVAKDLTSGTLDIRSPIRNGALLVLDRSIKDIFADSGVTAVEKMGKTPLHDLYATLIMALAQQNEPKYKDFLAKVIPNIQKHTVYTVKPDYLGAKLNNVPFGDYYVFGVWNDRYSGTMVWDKQFSMQSEYDEVELTQQDATIKFDDGTRPNNQ